MLRVVIDGIKVYDGEYELDVEQGFTNRELHTIKRLSGVRAAEFDEAFEAGDNDLIVALAAVTLGRAGKPLVDDLLWDAPVGAIKLVGDPEADADPPPLPTSASSTSASGSAGSSGTGSSGSSESPETDPSGTGQQGSATGATSDQETSAT